MIKGLMGEACWKVAFRYASVFVVACLLSLSSAAARAVETDALRRKQDAQERARDMARQLVTGILDVQLQQLEENGLKKLPLYRDIALMRKNIGALVAKDMEQVVELLTKAQRGGEAERDEDFRQARQMIRQVVTRLATERQSLSRRLKSAEIASQVQRLIDIQSKVWQATKSLPEQLPARQEALALAAIEDQGDVKQLFLQLVETLADVCQWGGPLGAGAQDGLQILQAAAVGEEIDSARSLLGDLRYVDAATSQQLAIKGLRLLLEKVNAADSQLSGDQNLGLALARSLIGKQEKLRDQTKLADLTQPHAERLVEEQAAIRKELNDLSLTVGSQAAAAPLLEQAKAAAYEATGRLFDARNDEAIAEQGKVLANLAELAEQLAQAPDASQTDKSAAEYARQVRDLELARADLDRIRSEQAQVDRSATENVAVAGLEEEQVARGLAKADDNRSLPKLVVSRLVAAEQAAAAAAKELARGPAKSAAEPQKQTLERASRAIERASAEIAAALDDTRRKAAAVEIGELARAAETLERAAAAEREVARETQQAAGQSGIGADAAKQLGDRHAEVEAIARSIAQAVEASANEAAQAALAAAQSAAAAREQLDQASAKPGADSKSAAQSAAQSSASAAEKLSQAAAKIRRQIEKSAEALAAESEKQLQKVSPVREAVDVALEQGETSASERMERLAQAERAVRDALAAQQRASGRPAAADAAQLADAIAEARDDQARADQAAQQLADGKSSSPLETVRREQAVAEQTAKLAEAAGKRSEAQSARAQGQNDPLQESLKEASRAAAQAARTALDGNRPAQAQAARDQTRKALEKAAQMAADEARQAAHRPATGKPDTAAQKQVGERAADAGKLVRPDATAAGESLANAEKSSGEAQRQARAGNDEKARAAQDHTAQSLQAAAEQIKSARDKLAQDQVQQLAKQARQAEQLALRAATVDSGALGALREAQSHASQPPANPPTSPSENSTRAAAAQKQARQDIQRASANLNARQQRLERDKAIAEGVCQMCRKQGQAASDIASRSADLLASKDDDQLPSEEDGDSKPNADDGKQGNSTDKPNAAGDQERASTAKPNAAGGKRSAATAKPNANGRKQGDSTAKPNAVGDQDGASTAKPDAAGGKRTAATANPSAADGLRTNSSSAADPNADDRQDGTSMAEAGKSSKRRQAAERLAQAQREFAQGQRGAGEAAEEIAGQSQIANRPLREAMERASKLPFPNLPLSNGPLRSDVSRAPQDPNDATGDLQAASNSSAGKLSTSKSDNSIASNRPPLAPNTPVAPKSPGEPPDAGQGPAAAARNDRNDLGTGFIPNSPEATAEMMTGPDAAAQAAALLGSDYSAQTDGRETRSEMTDADEPGADLGQGPTTQQQGQRQGKRQGRSSSIGSSSGSSKDGPSSGNLDLRQGVPQAGTAATEPGENPKGATSSRSANGAARALGQESWFTKLPPDLRKAIRAKAQRPPPRSYEEKLQKYFGSIE